MTQDAASDSPDMCIAKTFQVLSAVANDACAPRLGRFDFAGRRTIDSPNYTAVTSRGAVPHLTPDNVSRHTSVSAALMALEDFVERKESPIFQTPTGDHGRLQTFTALPPDRTTILTARRCPPVLAPMGNMSKSVTLFTSQGFASLTIPQYASAAERLRPDVVVALSDALHSSTTPASKKLIKMAERTEEWVDEFLGCLSGRQQTNEPRIPVFAPVLPVELPMQWEYLRHLAEDVRDSLSGLAIYDVGILAELARYRSLVALPKLSLDPPQTPHEVLRQVALGVDLCALPLINNASDAGIALTFTFPPSQAAKSQPLGVDMGSQEHATSLAPLFEGCSCYTCKHHHRAYLHHLLSAREMLGWTLLQIHNKHVFDDFFAGIRRSLGKEAVRFGHDRMHFETAYERTLPEGVGQRPRARGYHCKSETGQDKINKPAWTDLEEKAAGIGGKAEQTA